VFHQKRIAVLAVVCGLATGCGSRLDRQQLQAANEPFYAVGARGETTTAHGTPAAGPDSAGAVPTTTTDAAPPGSPQSKVSAPHGGGQAQPSAEPKARTEQAPGGGAPDSPQRAGAPTPQTPSVPAPGVSATPSGNRSEILLGSVGTSSGIIGRAVQPTRDGAKAWVADINARGGLAGHPVRVIFGDDGGDPGRALSLARQMVEQQRVTAFYAFTAATTGQAIYPYIEGKNIPVLSSCDCNNADDDSPMVFNTGPGTTVGLAWAHFLPAIDFYPEKKKLGVLYCSEAPVCPAIFDNIKKVAPQAGYQLVWSGRASMAQPDYTAEIIAARNAGVEVFTSVAEGTTLIRVVRSAKRQSWAPTFVTQFAAADEGVIKAGGSDLEGVLLAQSGPNWMTSPKMADYRAAMDRYVPGGIRGGIGVHPWTAGKVLEHLAPTFLSKATVTTQDILDGLYSIDGETFGGLLPPTKWPKDRGHWDTNLCMVSSRIKDQKLETARGDETFTCAPGWKKPN